MRRASAAWMTLLALAACDCEEPPEVAEETTEHESEPEEEARPARVGTVRGVVRIPEGAELPRFAEADLKGPQSIVPWAESCSPLEDTDYQPVTLSGERGLRGIVVSVSGDDEDEFFAALPQREPETHHVRIADCRLSPRILGVAVGDTIEVLNATDGEAFIPVIGAEPFMEVLPSGQTRSFPVDFQGVAKLMCAFSTPCGRTDVVVHHHPVYAITGDDGSFEIPNVPAGQRVYVHAWHPLFDYDTEPAEVELNGETSVELELTPRAPAPTPEPGDDEETGEPPELF